MPVMSTGLMQQILDFVGGEPTAKMQEYAFITACVLLVLTCWGLVKVAQWFLNQ